MSPVLPGPGKTAIPKSVIVVGGGVAGMSAACALAEAGLRVKLVERRGYLGGRASSYRHPGVDEVIDNCQHVLFGCCTNLIGFYQRIGVADRIHWTSDDDHDRAGRPAARVLGPSSWLPAPLARPAQLLAAQGLHARRQDGAGARVSRAHAAGACGFHRNAGRVAAAATGKRRAPSIASGGW